MEQKCPECDASQTEPEKEEYIEIGQLCVGKHGFSIGINNQRVDITKLHGNYKLFIKNI